jgi:hypothetical protein
MQSLYDLHHCWILDYKVSFGLHSSSINSEGIDVSAYEWDGIKEIDDVTVMKHESVALLFSLSSGDCRWSLFQLWTHTVKPLCCGQAECCQTKVRTCRYKGSRAHTHTHTWLDTHINSHTPLYLSWTRPGAGWQTHFTEGEVITAATVAKLLIFIRFCFHR